MNYENLIPNAQAINIVHRRTLIENTLELYVYDRFVCIWDADHVKATDPVVMDEAIRAAFLMGIQAKTKQIKEVLDL